MARRVRTTVIMDPETLKLLDSLANHYGESRSSILDRGVRLLVSKDANETRKLSPATKRPKR